MIPVSWLWTALAFTDRRAWLRRRPAALLLVEPAVFAALVWTNGWHELVWADAAVAAFGPTGSRVMTLDVGVAFWAHQIYSYGLVIAGALVVLSMILRTEDIDRTQATALLRPYPDADLDAEVPETCWILAGSSLSVVWNELITNALLHNDGVPRVRIAVDEEASDDRNVVLTVEDDGQGLEEQEWRAIAEGGETPLDHGSGFCLGMVTWIVRTYGAPSRFRTARTTRPASLSG